MGSDFKNFKDVLKNGFTKERLETFENYVKTGFKEFDTLLGGGLRPGFNIMGAVPSIGKSTFSLQLACNVAMNDNEEERRPVLYFSLEESAMMLVAKTVCRKRFEADREKYKKENNYDYLDDRNAALDKYYTTTELLQSSKFEKWEKLKDKLLEKVKETSLEIYDEPVSAEEIVNIVNTYIETNKNKKTPLVIVDYFQIIKSPNELSPNASSKQIADKNLETFKELKRRDVPLLLISSLNRGSYNKPLEMDSFKETGGLEYNADLLLGLQFSAVHDLDKKQNAQIDDNKEKSKFPREVEIMILKQRYGTSGEPIKFKYYPQFCYFEVDNSEKNNSVSKEEGKKARTKTSSEGMTQSHADTGNDTQTEEKEEAKSNETSKPKANNKALDNQMKTKYKDSYINNTMIANEIRKGEYTVNEYKECKVFGKGNEITTRYKIDSELTCFDCDVADAVYSIYRRNISKRDQSFTVKDALRELSGKCDQEPTFKDGSNGDIIFKSLKKLSKAAITIECPAEAEKRNEETNGKNMKSLYEGNFLNIELSNENNGKAARITFKKENRMPLFDYAEPTQQVIRFPNELLNTKNAFSNTIQNIMIKRYLIRRLEIIKKENNGYYGKSIRYITNSNGCLFRELSISRDNYGSDEAWNKVKRDTHFVIKIIMKRLKEIGYLTDFEETDDKNGIDITGKIIKDPFELPDLKR